MTPVPVVVGGAPRRRQGRKQGYRKREPLPVASSALYCVNVHHLTPKAKNKPRPATPFGAPGYQKTTAAVTRGAGRGAHRRLPLPQSSARDLANQHRAPTACAVADQASTQFPSSASRSIIRLSTLFFTNQPP